MQRLIALRRASAIRGGVWQRHPQTATLPPTLTRLFSVADSSSSSSSSSTSDPHPSTTPTTEASSPPSPPPSSPSPSLREIIKHVALSSDEQEELFRQGGKELNRAWEKDGGVKPGIARLERSLHGNNLDQMEKSWKEMKKQGMEVEHYLKCLLIVLDDKHFTNREAASRYSGRRRVRLGWQIYEDMIKKGYMSIVTADGSLYHPPSTIRTDKDPARDGDLLTRRNNDLDPLTHPHHHNHHKNNQNPQSPPPTPVNYGQRAKIYYTILSALAASGDGWKAKALSRHMATIGFQPNEEALSNLIMALAKCRLRREAQDIFDEARRRAVILSSAAKSCLISCHTRARDAPAAAHVLNVTMQEASLNDNPGEVSGNMVKKVLEAGIETADIDVLRQGLSALRVCVIDRGMGLQILNIAAKKGDGQMAMDVFYAMESWGYAPTASTFNAVLQALVLSKNDVAMLKALNEMVTWGFTPSQGTLHLAARQLAQSVARLDEAYNNLVVLRRNYEEYQSQLLRQQQEGGGGGGSVGNEGGEGGGGEAVVAAAEGAAEGEGATAATAAAPIPLPVSGAAVYLIVLGCAYAKQLDRAFATFEDYGPVFGLQHDIQLCNALLLACMRSRSLQLGAATSVLTEMERLGVEPDAETCHLMVRILVNGKTADVAKMEEVLASMEEKGVVLRADTMRMLVLWYALLGNHGRAQELLGILQVEGAYIPTYLPERVQQIQENGDRL